MDHKTKVWKKVLFIQTCHSLRTSDETFFESLELHLILHPNGRRKLSGALYIGTLRDGGAIDKRSRELKKEMVGPQRWGPRGALCGAQAGRSRSGCSQLKRVSVGSYC